MAGDQPIEIERTPATLDGFSAMVFDAWQAALPPTIRRNRGFGAISERERLDYMQLVHECVGLGMQQVFDWLNAKTGEPLKLAGYTVAAE